MLIEVIVLNIGFVVTRTFFAETKHKIKGRVLFTYFRFDIRECFTRRQVFTLFLTRSGFVAKHIRDFT